MNLEIRPPSEFYPHNKHSVPVKNENPARRSQAFSFFCRALPLSSAPYSHDMDVFLRRLRLRMQQPYCCCCTHRHNRCQIFRTIRPENSSAHLRSAPASQDPGNGCRSHNLHRWIGRSSVFLQSGPVYTLFDCEILRDTLETLFSYPHRPSVIFLYYSMYCFYMQHILVFILKHTQREYIMYSIYKQQKRPLYGRFLL